MLKGERTSVNIKYATKNYDPVFPVFFPLTFLFIYLFYYYYYFFFLVNDGAGRPERTTRWIAGKRLIEVALKRHTH